MYLIPRIDAKNSMETIENKRKCDEGLGENPSKAKKFDRCSDLIVLGLPWTSTENDLKIYFEKFGDLLMVQVSTVINVYK